MSDLCQIRDVASNVTNAQGAGVAGRFGERANSTQSAYEEAAVWAGQSVTAYPHLPIARFFLAAALGQLGRIAEARAQAEAGLALNPGFTIRRFHEQPDCDNPIYLEQRHNIYEGLRKAGVSEE